MHLMKVELKWYFAASKNVEFSNKETGLKLITVCSGSVH